MPYKSVSELPPGVKDALPMHGQQIYMAAYNSALDNTCKNAGERQKECCAKVAWAAVKNTYKQDAKGNWVEKKELKNKEDEPLIFQVHDSILNTLDRQSSGTFLSADSFKDADKWNGIKVVFAQDHPKDFDAFIQDPESEVSKIDGRIIGIVKDARIDMEGHPRLMATLDINDAQAEDLIKQGKLSISTAFKVALKDGKTVGPVTPNHVLAFEETNKDQPGDKGAFILNKEDDIRPEEENRFMRWLKRKETIADIAGEINMVEDTKSEVAKEDDTSISLKNKDEEIENIKKEMKLKDEKISSLESELTKFKEEKENAEWISFKEKYIPPGWVHTEEDEKKIREEYKSDKYNLLVKAVDAQKSAPTKEEGLQFMAGNKDDDYEAKMRKLGIPRIDFELKEVD